MKLFIILLLISICVYSIYELFKDDLNAKKKMLQLLPEYARNSDAFKTFSKKCSNIPREYLEMANVLTNYRIYNKSLLMFDVMSTLKPTV